MLESLLISFLGSAIGLGLGVSCAKIIMLVLKIQVPFYPISAIAALTVAIVVGIFSGLFPAYKAAKLEPIDSLRYQ